jgi:hypothetical protein
MSLHMCCDEFTKSESAYTKLLLNKDQMCWLHIFKVKTSAKPSLQAATTSMSFQSTSCPILLKFSSGLVLNIRLLDLLQQIQLFEIRCDFCLFPLKTHHHVTALRNQLEVSTSEILQILLCTREMSPSTQFYFLRFNL